MSSGIIKFLDPKTDVVFKKVFGSNPNITKSFLNGLLPLPENNKIIEFSFLSSAYTSRFQDINKAGINVRCQNQEGDVFSIELQFFGTDRFRNKLLYRSTELFGQQVKNNGNYNELYPVYGLGIVNAIFTPQTNEWFHHYKMTNVRDHSKTMGSIQLIFIELPKFTPQSLSDRNTGVLWLRFLKEIDEHTINIPREFESVPEIMEAIELIRVSAFTPAELDEYYQFRDMNDDIKTTNMANSQKTTDEIAENKAYVKQEIVKKLLAQKLDLNLISLATGLSIEDILHIRSLEEGD